MVPFITNLFSKLSYKNNMTWYASFKKITRLKESLQVIKDRLESETVSFVRANAKDLYISIEDLASLQGDFSIDDIYKKAKHVNELNGSSTSSIEVYACIEQEHVVLCPDKDNCDQHKHISSDKIKIVMVR